MLLNLRGTTQIGAATMAVAAILFTAAGARAACSGDCNNNGELSAGDVTKIVRIINLCGGARAGCAAIRGTDKQCTNADLNGNGTITVDELMAVVTNVITFHSGCAPQPPTATPTLTRTQPAQVGTATPTPTRTPTATSQPTLTPTTGGGTGLGTRVFSLGPASGFFSSLLPTFKAGTPAGTLMLNAGPMDAMGHATLTVTNAPLFITNSIPPPGGLTLCTRIDSCTGTLYCTGGANVDTVSQLDSLMAGKTCMRDGTHNCPATSTFCCSNACEGVGVGSGNQPTRMSAGNTTDSGAGSALLMCQEHIVSLPMEHGDCTTADYSAAVLTNELLTTGTSTAKVTNFCSPSTTAATKALTFSKTGQKFDCSQWTTENGPGGFAFSIPAEEGSAIIPGDGSNAGIYSDH